MQEEMRYRKIKDLKELPNNPRTIKDDDFEKLCKSIKENPEFFEARPIILSDRTGDLVIIAGNQRFKAAKHLKLKEVPTFLIFGLSEEKEREIIIRDNISNGQWDIDVLKANWDPAQLEEWGLSEIDFDTETELDKGVLTGSANSYLNNSVRQIVLYFDVETHKEVLAKLEKIGLDHDIEEDNSATVLKLIEHYENN